MDKTFRSALRPRPGRGVSAEAACWWIRHSPVAAALSHFVCVPCDDYPAVVSGADDPTPFLRTVRRLVQSGETQKLEEALRFAAARWREQEALPASVDDAEACRLLMLAATRLESWEEQVTWRARAMTRYTLLGWWEGIATLTMGEAFRALAIANEEYARGKTLNVIVGSPAAVSIIGELEFFLTLPGSGRTAGGLSPNPRLLRRFLFEKRAFFRLVDRDVHGARADYERALAENEGLRGRIKVGLGLVLVDLLDGTVDAAVAASATEALAAQLDEEHGDLLEISAHNVETLRQGSPAVRAYEYL